MGGVGHPITRNGRLRRAGDGASSLGGAGCAGRCRFAYRPSDGCAYGDSSAYLISYASGQE